MVFVAFPVAFFLFIASLIALAKAFKRKEVFISHLLLGSGLSGLIYMLIFIDYYFFTTTAYALGTGFMFPFYMVIFPAVTGLITVTSPRTFWAKASTLFFFSAVLSAVAMCCFPDYTFRLPEYLGIPIYY